MRHKLFFENNYWYHVYNRGVEKRIVFFDDEDRERFLYYLFECNNKEQIVDIPFSRRKKNINHGSLTSAVSDKRKNLVEIGCFVLMPNHFHFLLRQNENGGISLFMQKLCTGYVKYFNNKYNRVGGLFQGTFKAKLIKNNEYFNYLLYYLLLNPAEILFPKRNELDVKNHNKLKDFLEFYKWSSYQEFMNKSKLPFSITNKEIIMKNFENKEFEDFLNDLTSTKEREVKLELIKDCLLD